MKLKRLVNFGCTKENLMSTSGSTQPLLAEPRVSVVIGEAGGDLDKDAKIAEFESRRASMLEKIARVQKLESQLQNFNKNILKTQQERRLFQDVEDRLGKATTALYRLAKLNDNSLQDSLVHLKKDLVVTNESLAEVIGGSNPPAYVQKINETRVEFKSVSDELIAVLEGKIKVEIGENKEEQVPQSSNCDKKAWCQAFGTSSVVVAAGGAIALIVCLALNKPDYFSYISGGVAVGGVGGYLISRVQCRGSAAQPLKGSSSADEISHNADVLRKVQQDVDDLAENIPQN
jgi:hypothetical protein